MFWGVLKSHAVQREPDPILTIRKLLSLASNCLRKAKWPFIYEGTEVCKFSWLLGHVLLRSTLIISFRLTDILIMITCISCIQDFLTTFFALWSIPMPKYRVLEKKHSRYFFISCHVDEIIPTLQQALQSIKMPRLSDFQCFRANQFWWLMVATQQLNIKAIKKREKRLDCLTLLKLWRIQKNLIYYNFQHALILTLPAKFLIAVHTWCAGRSVVMAPIAQCEVQMWLNSSHGPIHTQTGRFRKASFFNHLFW